MGKIKRDEYLRDRDIKWPDFLPERRYTINHITVIPRGFTNDFDMLSSPREEITAKHFALNENETFVDVGANVGKYALTVAKDYNSKSVRIIAIEAQPENYKALCRNVQLNKDFRNDLIYLYTRQYLIIRAK
jgi:predicted RNA methylase